MMLMYYCVLGHNNTFKGAIKMSNKTIYSKDFILVVIGQIISIFGNQIIRYALPLYLLLQTGSSTVFGVISAVAFIPMLVLYPVGGIIADRYNKKNIMVILDFSTSGLIFLFSVLAGDLDVVPLIGITMMILYGIQGAYQPAVKASVPVLVDTEHIMQANSLVDVINSLASMAGPVIGGILFSIYGLTPILYISVICFFASAVMEIFIHIPFEKMVTKGNMFVTGLSDLKDSFSFIFREQPVLWKMSLVYAAENLFLTALILISAPVLITQYLDFSTNTANQLYGYAQGVIAAGAILGGLLTGVLSKKLNARTSPLLLIGCALCILLSGIGLQVFHDPMIIYITMITGFGLLMILSTLFQIQLMSYFQMVTPLHLLGKVISCVICVCMCTNPVGQFIYGIVFEHIGDKVYLPFYIAAIAVIVISVLTRRTFNKFDDLVKEQTDEIV